MMGCQLAAADHLLAVGDQTRVERVDQGAAHLHAGERVASGGCEARVQFQSIAMPRKRSFRPARRRRPAAARMLPAHTAARRGCRRTSVDRCAPTFRRPGAARWRARCRSPLCSTSWRATRAQDAGEHPPGTACPGPGRRPSTVRSLHAALVGDRQLPARGRASTRYSRSGCQQISAPNSPRFIASSMASKPGRVLPLYALMSLSS